MKAYKWNLAFPLSEILKHIIKTQLLNIIFFFKTYASCRFEHVKFIPRLNVELKDPGIITLIVQN